VLDGAWPHDSWRCSGERCGASIWVRRVHTWLSRSDWTTPRFLTGHLESFWGPCLHLHCAGIGGKEHTVSFREEKYPGFVRAASSLINSKNVCQNFLEIT
jgi:hypothetical protein